MSNSYNTTITMSKEEYETVAGYSLGPAPRNGQGSSGYYEQGINILYESGGITGQNWHTGDPDSPFFGFTEFDIEADYDKNRDLSSYFINWGKSPTADREAFLRKIISSTSCWDLLNVT